MGRSDEAQVAFNNYFHKVPAECGVALWITIWNKGADAERERWKALYRSMRNVAAGYSNIADESGTARRLHKEFDQCEAEYDRLLKG